MRIRNVTVVAFGTALAALAAFAQGACDGANQPGATTSTDGGTTSSTWSSTGGGDSGKPLCAEPSGAPTTPAGWVWVPCRPGGCDVVVAPTPELMRPPPTWSSCGSGCLVMDFSWAGPTHGLFDSRGAARDGTRYLALMQDMGAGAAAHQIIRLPENVTTFDALMPSAVTGDICTMEIGDMTPGWTMFQLVYAGPPDQNVDRIVYRLQSGTANLSPTFLKTDIGLTDKFAVLDDWWAVSYQAGYRLDWHPNALSDQMSPAWQSSNGRSLRTMSSAAGTVFFSAELETASYEIYAFDPTGGLRTLIAKPNAFQGGACCLGSDGTTMAWLEGTGYDPTLYTYADVSLKTAPHATHATDVVPKTLRKSKLNTFLDGRWTIGGGYHLMLEVVVGPSGPGPVDLVLTRLSDGAYWNIPARPERIWGNPLYVDDGELAVIENFTVAAALDAGVTGGGGGSILRRTIASLGPPTLP